MKTDSRGMSLYPGVYSSAQQVVMAKKTTRIFSGNSQAVRMPKEFHLEGDEIEIELNAFVATLRESVGWHVSVQA